MTSEIRINTIKARSGLGTVDVNSSGINVAGIVTALGFSGDGSNLTNISASSLVLGTAQSVSGLGTSIIFTGIPSSVKRVTVMFDSISAGTSLNISPFLIQLGDSGGIESSGYLSTSSDITPSGVSVVRLTTGFVICNNFSGATYSGQMIISNLTGTTWVESGLFSVSTGSATATSSGSKTLSSTLDRIRITTSSGVPSFISGTINIVYES